MSPRPKVEFNAQQHNCPISFKLSNDGDTGHELASDDHLAVVRYPCDDLVQQLEPKSELLFDDGQLEPEEVQARWFAIGASLLAKLVVQLLKESGIDLNETPVGQRSED